jgi:anti-sigma factor ChrR (cupin superfamily)
VSAHPHPDPELLSLLAVHALPAADAERIAAHAADCGECGAELERLRTTVAAFVDWPTDVLRPPAPLWDRIAARIAEDDPGARPAAPSPFADRPWREPDWLQVTPVIQVKLLANDSEKHVVSMLVRLAPGGEYPPHEHAGTEELFLLDGELWIDDRLLKPGAYNRATVGTRDRRVYSETGCTCVLITSTRDVLG